MTTEVQTLANEAAGDCYGGAPMFVGTPGDKLPGDFAIGLADSPSARMRELQEWACAHCGARFESEQKLTNHKKRGHKKKGKA